MINNMNNHMYEIYYFLYCVYHTLKFEIDTDEIKSFDILIVINSCIKSGYLENNWEIKSIHGIKIFKGSLTKKARDHVKDILKSKADYFLDRIKNTIYES